MTPARTAGLAVILFLGTFASACATNGRTSPALPDFELQIRALVIENRTRAWVSAVQVLVPATGQYVSCGNIPPGGDCANRYPSLVYRGDAFQVTWSQSGRIWSTGDLELVPSEAIAEAGEGVMRVVISGPGSAGAELLEVP